MKLEYIKANGVRFYPVEPKTVRTGYHTFKPICYIKKLWFGRWQVDYYDETIHYHDQRMVGMMERNQTPSHRIILYPSGIEEIKYLLH